MKIYLRKVQRNFLDYGVWVTLCKIAAQVVQPIIEMRAYRLYKINLKTQSAPVPKLKEFTIRRLAPGEEDLISQVEHQEEWLQGQLQYMLKEERICFVALENNMVVGFYLISLNYLMIPILRLVRELPPRTAWSEQLTVWKSHRRQGIGMALKHHAFQELKELGIWKLYGSAQRHNVASLTLAQRLEFQEIADVHFLRILFFGRHFYRRMERF